MRWVITGAGGQVGSHARALLDGGGGDEVVAVDRNALDITDPAAVDAMIAEVAPDVVLNAAAYTAVDAAEDHEDDAVAANEQGPRLLARALARRGGTLVHVSTDYVFAGDATVPYEPGDPTGPRSAYGRTKLAGERAVHEELPERAHVVRTAWVYGGPSANFVDTMRRLERERDTVDVVTDQQGSPTYAGDLAAALIELGRAAADAAVPGGVLHYANTGRASWYDLAREVFRLAGADPDRVRPTTSEAFVRPAPRPAWSVLSSAAWSAAGLSAPRDWRAALADALAHGPSD